MMAARPGITFVRVEKRFGITEANRLRDTLELLAPVQHVLIDFSTAEHVEDAALSIVAQMLSNTPECKFRLEGLTHHRRRLLRYMGVEEQQQA